MPTLRTATLGCKVNQYETQYVREALQRIGYRNAADGEAADLCIVNTCTVTAEGDAKSRQTVRQFARRNPGTRIVVMGCYATRAPEEVARTMLMGEPAVTFRTKSGRLVRVVRMLRGGIAPSRICWGLGFGPTALWQMWQMDLAICSPTCEGDSLIATCSFSAPG